MREKELHVLGELNSFPWICISGVVHDPGDFSTPKRVKNNSSSAVSPSGSDGGASDTSGESSGPAFSWKDYLTETKSEAAPPSCFKQVRLLPIPPNYLNAFFVISVSKNKPLLWGLVLQYTVRIVAIRLQKRGLLLFVVLLCSTSVLHESGICSPNL